MMSVIRVLLLIVIAFSLTFSLSSCTGVRGGTYYRGGYGPGPYWGWGYDRTIIVDRPITEYPDIDEPIAVPMPEPVPDFGMPDYGGGMDMDMDMGGMDYGGFGDF